MAYVVEITAPAERDALEYHAFIRARSHDAIPADSWFKGLRQVIEELANFPARCPRIPEQEAFAELMHQQLYESHLIIFEITDDCVRVLRIYHSAASPLRTLKQRPARPKK
ncbi:type II toxin-antitoxin system RelE/ParE family toxin [Granulicella cerasi]|uniref:Type II toxin-antitoxin system RelE/ParE family toxin n=1 Tax=Granulicella cerasi TaxID=741063 RepID=A0ABW1ZDC3_9BACT|nr:type II toxin-antitoxin system RelE/ParE family toxin [Granulicella cerasi]